MRRHLLWFPIALGAMACSSGARTTGAESPRSQAETPHVATEQQADLSPVSMPAELFSWLHIENPAETLPLVGELVPTRLGGLTNLRPILHNNFGPDLADLVDQGKPFDLALTRAGAIVSIALQRSFSPGRYQHKLGLTRRADATYEVGPLKAPQPNWRICRIVPAAGAAAFRLVCSNTRESLEVAIPWLARSASRLEKSSLVRFEVTRGGFMFGKDFAVRHADEAVNKSDPVEARGAKLGVELLTELLSDYDGAVLKFDVGKSSIEVQLEMALRSPRSVFNLALLGRADAPASVPAAFWQLPAADIAFYFQGSAPEKMRPLGATLLKKFMDAMPEEVLDARGRIEFARGLAGCLFRGGPSVWALGYDRPRGQQTLASELPRLPASSARSAVRDALSGWTLGYLEEPFEDQRAALRELMRVMTTDYRPKSAPGASKPPPPAPKPERYRSTYRELAVQAQDGLPRDCAHWEDIEEPNPKYVPKNPTEEAPAVPHVNHLYLCGQGRGSWLALGESTPQLLAQLRQALSGNKQKPEGLGPLGAHRGAGIGYLSLAGLVSLGLSGESESKVREALASLASLSRLSKRGATRLPLRLESSSGKDGREVLRISASLTSAFLGDVLSFSTDEGGEP